MNIPEGFDNDVINKWVGKQEVLADSFDEKRGTFWVVTEKNGDRQVLRFFIIGQQTHASVDYDSNWSNSETLLLQRFCDSNGISVDLIW